MARIEDPAGSGLANVSRQVVVERVPLPNNVYGGAPLNESNVTCSSSAAVPPGRVQTTVVRAESSVIVGVVASELSVNRAMRLHVVVPILMKAPPMRILPSGCIATAYGGPEGVGGETGSRKLRSIVPLVSSRPKNCADCPSNVLKSPTTKHLPSFCTANPYTPGTPEDGTIAAPGLKNSSAPSPAIRPK